MIAEQARAPFIPVRSAGMPRSTLWGLSVPLVVIAGRLGLVDIPADGYELAAAELERVSHLCRPDSESFVNPAKTLALELAGALPMIWGTSPLAGVAAYRFACQLNENAKYPAVAGVAARGQPQPGGRVRRAVRARARPGSVARSLAVPLRLVLLRDSREHPQVSLRREESARLAAGRGIGVTELAASGDGPLERLASLVQLIDYATVYLAIALGIDPGPVAAIGELKARIA